MPHILLSPQRQTFRDIRSKGSEFCARLATSLDVWRILDAAPSSHHALSPESHLFPTPIMRPNIVINIRACRSGASLSSPRMEISLACINI